jgi:hypothetical protein
MYDSGMKPNSKFHQTKGRLLFGFIMALLSGIGLGSSASATKIEAGLAYPLVAGMAGQSFNSNLGLTGAITFAPMIEPWISNWVSVDYYSLTWRSDTAASFRILPILAGVSLPGKVTEGVTSEFGLGLGGAIGYLNSPGVTAYRTFGYFAAQFRGGMEVDLGSGISTFARIPVTVIVGAKPMTFLSFILGAGYQF